VSLYVETFFSEMELILFQYHALKALETTSSETHNTNPRSDYMLELLLFATGNQAFALHGNGLKECSEKTKLCAALRSVRCS